MELKLKLLAVAGTVALGTWIYADFIDTDPAKEALKKQAAPFVIVEDNTFENTVDRLEQELGGQEAEPLAPVLPGGRTRPVKKSSLTPQGPLFNPAAPRPAPMQPDQTAPRPITPDDALAAALDGSTNSLRLLQDYFDATTGRPKDISERVSNLLDALAALPFGSGNQALENAAKRIIDAAARAASSAYALPYRTDSEFGLNRGDLAWDFGPDDKTPHRGFLRVGPQSRLISGKGLVALEAGKENLFTRDGILNVEKFSTDEIGEDSFRVFVVTTPLPSGSRLAYPFGRKFGFNGNELRLVDAGTGDQGEPRRYARLTSSGINLSDAAPNGNDPSENGATPLIRITSGDEDTQRAEGWVLTTLLKTSGAPLRFDFEKLGDEETYVVGIILSPTDIDGLEKTLNEKLLAFLNNIAPAGGEDTPNRFNNDFTARTFTQFFTNPNTRSGLGPDASPVEAFQTASLTPGPGTGGGADGDNGGGDNGGGDNGGGDNGGGDNGGGDNGGGDNDGGDNGGGDNGGGDNGGGDNGGGDNGGGDNGGGDNGGGDNGGGDNGGGDNGGGDNGGGGTPPVLVAEAGPDQTITWGLEDFNLDGCGLNGSSLAGISLCDLETALGDTAFDDLFDIVWLVDGMALNGTDDALRLGDLLLHYPGIFTGPGNYVIELVIHYTGEAFIHNGITFSHDQILEATDYMTLYIVSAPAGLSLTTLGVIGILGIRRRRLKDRGSEPPSSR